MVQDLDIRWLSLWICCNILKRSDEYHYQYHYKWLCRENVLRDTVFDKRPFYPSQFQNNNMVLHPFPEFWNVLDRFWYQGDDSLHSWVHIYQAIHGWSHWQDIQGLSKWMSKGRFQTPSMILISLMHQPFRRKGTTTTKKETTLKVAKWGEQ